MKAADIQAVWPQWENIGLLGAGRYGKVHLCHSQLDGQDVFSAVKVIDIPPNQNAVQAAQSQGISLDMLKMYFGKFRDDLNWELSMYKPAAGAGLAAIDDCVFEEAEGEPGWRAYIRTGVFTPLASYYGRNKATETEAARMGVQLCAALEQLDRFGLVHGEICPSNVMVMDTGDFVLTDFGIRRCLDKAGAGLFAAKRDSFDAPEVTSYNYVSKSSDIYSVGMMILYVLNGGVLPKGNNAKGALGEIIHKATAYNAQERYQSAAEMRAELEKLVDPAAPVRRANAAVTALELTKENASAAPAQPQQAEPVRPVKPAQRQRDTKEARNVRRSRVAQIISVLLILLAIAAVLFVLRPWEKTDNDDSGKTGQDTHMSNNAETDDKNDSHSENEANGDQDGADVNKTPDVTGKGDGIVSGEGTGLGDDQTQTSDGTSGVPEDGTIGDTTNTEGDASTGEGDSTTAEGDGPVSVDLPDVPGPGDGGDEGGMDVPGPGSSAYILPSDTQYLTMEDLEGMSKWEATKALNEIYARHGLIFGNDDLAEYFESQSWYEGTTTSASKAAKGFNEYEQANVDLIVKYMKQKGYR